MKGYQSISISRKDKFGYEIFLVMREVIVHLFLSVMVAATLGFLIDERDSIESSKMLR